MFYCLNFQNNSRKDAVKKEILQRIEPWIMRELQAILGDPDPTVIVHVVTSQFIAWLEEKAKLPSGQLDIGDSFISPLRPFLHDKTIIFWHELRYFILTEKLCPVQWGGMIEKNMVSCILHVTASDSLSVKCCLRCFYVE